MLSIKYKFYYLIFEMFAIVCMYQCMYAYMCICMHACMHVCYMYLFINCLGLLTLIDK